MHGIILLLMLSIVSTFSMIPHDMSVMIDPKVDPCDDFYHYACGKWLDTHSLGPTDIRIESTDMIKDRTKKTLIDLIKHDPMLTEWWESCLGIDKSTGQKHLTNDLNRIINAPTIEQVMELAGEFSRTGTNAWINPIVASDPDDASLETLHFKVVPLTLLSAEHYTKIQFEFRTEYYKYINHLMTLSGFSLASDKRKRTDTFADIVFHIERQLATFSMEIKNIAMFPIKDVIKYLPLLVGSYLKGTKLFKTTKIRADMKVYIDHPTYYNAVNKLIQTLSLDQVKIYVAFVMIHSRSQWLGNDFYTVRFKMFGQTIAGQVEPPSREYYCQNRVVEYLPELIGKEYYKKEFDSKREQRAYEMITLIRDTMKHHISGADWMKPDDQKAAIRKLDNIIPLVGHPKEYSFHSFSLSRDDYYSNIYTILSHKFDRMVKRIGQRVNRMEWPVSAASINAYYVRQRNVVVFPAAILQPPLFHGEDVHPARDFGGIGSVMGHEITHGFDYHGRFYDEVGNRRLWWSSETLEMFEDRAKSIIDQYSSFTVKGIHGDEIGTVRGNVTINENIADMGGLAVAWSAYRKYMTSGKHNVPDNGDHLFFLAYGQSYCRKIRDEYAINLLTTTSHSPHQWRVNGVLMNNRDFATTFQCKVNTRMNPLEKYVIW